MIDLDEPKTADDRALVEACNAAGGFPRIEGGAIVGGPAPVQPTNLRPVQKVSIAGVKPSMAKAAAPTFVWVDPATLLVDETYQRSLSEKSTRLIRRIIGGWDWRRFKPPVCARTRNGMEVIDGQHTAIAAASHPDIVQIPVMVVEAPERENRAEAFVSHNRDRLGITPMQLHHAALAAGDAEARSISEVCGAAGIRLLKATPGNGEFKPGDCVAIRGIGALINRRGAEAATDILKVLVASGAAPVGAGAIKAVETLLYEDEYRDEVDLARIGATLIEMRDQIDREAAVFREAHRVPQWRALAVVLFREAKRRRRRGDAQ